MKRNLKKMFLLMAVVLIVFSCVFITNAITYNGIANNGTDGIYIDIYSEPYTSMAKVPEWGKYAYGPSGCAWFATSRVKQLTGKNITTIYSGKSWYNERYDDFGFTRGQTIKAKALACYESHVAVVEKVNGNTVTISEGGNTSYPNNDYCVIRHRTISQVESGNFLGYVYIGVDVSWKNSVSKVNLGDDFYARIVNTDSNKALTNLNDNVILHSRTNAVDQIWHFTRNGDGTYNIISKLNNKSLDVYDASAQASTNVQVWSHHGGAAQKWSIYGSSSKYVLSADCTDCVIDIQGGGYDDGTNIIMFTKHEGVNQLFTIEKIAAPSKPSLNISSNGKLTLFKWDKVSNADSYELKIMKDGSTYKTVTNLTSNSSTVDLPNGIYTAILTAKNTVYNTNSNSYNFTVNYNSVNSGDWQYATSLPTGVTAEKYVIEYKHSYKQIAKTSPGSGWIKGDVAKREYENSGDVYYSALPLDTSDTRVLVNYSYYHWCSKNKGDEVNYESTSTFSHYDGVNANNVYEFYSHADYADSRYTFYGLKYKDSNNYVYCCSGVTCDGSYGTHGNRSYYWYKMYAYQDKVAVDYYTYTKQGDWTTVKDTSAVSYSVRYKLIEKDECADGHTYKTTTTKATITKNGKIVTKCSECGEIKSTATIYSPKTITLSKTAYTYNGKEQKPSVTVKDSKGKTLKNGTDYTVKYENGRIQPGRYNVKITFKGKYSGEKRVTYTIAPKCPSKVTAVQSTSAIKLTWSKVTGATGYRVYQYNAKTKTWDKIKTTTATSFKISNLKAGTTYKYRIKCYKNDAGLIWGKATSDITVATKPATPKITAVASTAKGRAAVAWTNVAGETGYELWASTKKDTGYKKIVVAKANVTKGVRTGLVSGRTYYFRVRAYKTVGNTVVYSALSAPQALKIK